MYCACAGYRFDGRLKANIVDRHCKTSSSNSIVLVNVLAVGRKSRKAKGLVATSDSVLPRLETLVCPILDQGLLFEVLGTSESEPRAKSTSGTIYNIR